MVQTMPLSEFMEISVQDHREHLAGAFAEHFREPCPICEGTSYLADATGVPCRDEEDDTDDFVNEFILFVCAACGTVFYTDELTMFSDTRIGGRLVAVESEEEFCQMVRDSVGYEKGS